MKSKTIIALLLIGLGFYGTVSAQETDTKKTSGDIIIDRSDNALNMSGLTKKPEYPGGLSKFYSDFNDEFKIPKIPYDGTYKVYVSFVIEKDGSLTGIKILRDPGYSIGEEVCKALLRLDKKWSPGELNGEPVRASYNLPITINIK